MTHLTFDEIIDFVSADKLDKKTLDLAVKVNTHIGSCNKCLEKVRAFQQLYDEMYLKNEEESYIEENM